MRYYCCIDMKCFYASVECADLEKDPFLTNLVVADKSRGKNALCLAISPKLKAAGIKNRCRLSDVPDYGDLIVATPRMRRYIEVCADIYELYLTYFSPDDIHQYSIDEAFIDLTDYLTVYDMTPTAMAKFLLDRIQEVVHIPATAGVGTNLYLAKIALDITAKKAKERVAYLDEEIFRRTLWTHEPLSDFWGISRGISARLRKIGVPNQKGVTECPKEVLYKIFGVNAELLIDHAFGKESCLLSDIKAYKSRSRSLSTSQILPYDYTYAQARTVLSEMVLDGCQRMMRRGVVTHSASLYVGYTHDDASPDGGTVTMTETTANFSILSHYLLTLYDDVADRTTLIRRLGISFNDVRDERCENYDLFTDVDKVEKENRAERTALRVKDKFGKNAILRAVDLKKEGTTIERNGFIGGHKA